MIGWLTLAGLGVGIALLRRWFRRQWADVGDYYEGDHGDPPVSDVSSWMGGRGS